MVKREKEMELVKNQIKYSNWKGAVTDREKERARKRTRADQK